MTAIATSHPTGSDPPRQPQGAELRLREVRFGYPARPAFLGPISLSIEPGSCWAIVGPNGAGKSTLLRLMAGLARPHAGEVAWGGRPLGDIAARRRARDIAVVPQRVPCDLDLPVRDVVLMGRFPHRSLGLFESAADFRAADRAMELTRTRDFADRPLSTLSAGEAQRVHLAAALAQSPQLLLLDEPTASLDLQHQLGIFQILRERASRDGLSVVVVTHDVNLAAQFCTHVVLLHQGRVVAAGRPGEVLDPAVLAPVYAVSLTSVTLPGSPDRFWIVPYGGTGEASA